MHRGSKLGLVALVSSLQAQGLSLGARFLEYIRTEAWTRLFAAPASLARTDGLHEAGPIWSC